MKRSILVICGLLFMTGFANAATTETKSETPNVPVDNITRSGDSVSATSISTAGAGSQTLALPDALKNKKYEQNTEITDTKLQADSGSLSRYSAKFNLTYYGPTVDDLSKKSQPNPDGGIGVYDTSLGGSIGTRYRFDKNSTLSFGTGLNALTPLHGIQRVDVNNPYLSYDVTTKLGPVQMRNSPGVSYITVPNYRDVGETSGVNWDSSFVYGIASSRFALSFDSSFGYYFYSRGYVPSDRKAARFNWSLYPGLKYQFSDTLNFNTSLAVSYWNPRSSGSSTQLANKTVTQRIGLGWSIKRDIYFFPYLNIYPGDIAFNTTTLNFSTVFSIL